MISNNIPTINANLATSIPKQNSGLRLQNILLTHSSSPAQSLIYESIVS